jgi:hypothetical protein
MHPCAGGLIAVYIEGGKDAEERTKRRKKRGTNSNQKGLKYHLGKWGNSLFHKKKILSLKMKTGVRQ